MPGKQGVPARAFTSMLSAEEKIEILSIIKAAGLLGLVFAHTIARRHYPIRHRRADKTRGYLRLDPRQTQN